MKRRHASITILGLLIGFSSGLSSLSAQQSASGTVPVSTVGSVEAKHGKDIPAVNREDVRVFQGHNRLKVTDLIPLHADPPPFALTALTNDTSDTNPAA